MKLKQIQWPSELLIYAIRVWKEQIALFLQTECLRFVGRAIFKVRHPAQERENSALAQTRNLEVIQKTLVKTNCAIQ